MGYTAVVSGKISPGHRVQLDELSWESGRSVSELVRISVERLLSDLGIEEISEHEENDSE